MLKQGMVHTVPGFVSMSRDKGLFCERDIIVFRAVQLEGRFGVIIVISLTSIACIDILEYFVALAMAFWETSVDDFENTNIILLVKSECVGKEGTGRTYEYDCMVEAKSQSLWLHIFEKNAVTKSTLLYILISHGSPFGALFTHLDSICTLEEKL
ncbi:hypothetical protein HGM15179_006552 [Zosterops borbonicus]|uniref:Uncharacterized protein n=1 Tax=Zosterops borbonicus TaxID=364589 RepID=A0A8K1LNB1_9PASS|nr:hypothetical protein HGM15179_006552 [Zosterops borbonicus]